MNKNTANNKRAQARAARAYFAALTFDDCRRTALVTDNQKLRKTGQNVAGCSLYPNFAHVSGLSTCRFAKSCAITCILFSGPAELMASQHGELTHVEKAALRRTWLFFNNPDYFYSRIRTELAVLLLSEDTIFFRETTSECLDFSRIVSNGVQIYGYHKDPEVMTDESSPNKLNMFSWSERSTKDDIETARISETPVAVVVNFRLHREIMQGRELIRYNEHTIFVDGNADDLASYRAMNEYDLSGFLVIHLLREKNTRGGNAAIGQTPFFDSWKDIIGEDYTTC